MLDEWCILYDITIKRVLAFRAPIVRIDVCWQPYWQIPEEKNSIIYRRWHKDCNSMLLFSNDNVDKLSYNNKINSNCTNTISAFNHPAFQLLSLLIVCKTYTYILQSLSYKVNISKYLREGSKKKTLRKFGHMSEL